MSTNKFNELMIRDLPIKYSYNEYDYIIVEGRDGTRLAPLNSIMNEYASKILFYDSVEDLKHTNDLELGSIAMTLGNRCRGDGGRATYRIETGIGLDANDSTIIELYNKPLLKAVLIIEPDMNVKQFGAYGDGSHDDTGMIINAINNCDIIKFPVGEYLITYTIEIPANKQLIGPGTILTREEGIIHIENVNDLYIDGLNLKISNNKNGIVMNHSHTITISNFHIDKIQDNGSGIIIQNSKDILLENFTISGEYDTGNGIYFKDDEEDQDNSIQRVIIKDGIFHYLRNGLNIDTQSINGLVIEKCKFSFSNNEDGTSAIQISNANAYLNISDCYMINGTYGVKVNNSDNHSGKISVDSLTVNSTNKIYMFNSLNTDLILSGVHIYHTENENDYVFDIVNNPILLTNAEFAYDGYLLLNPILNTNHTGSLSDNKFPEHNLINPIIVKVTGIRSSVDVSKYTFSNTVLYFDFVGSSDLDLLITGITGGLNGQMIYIVGDTNIILPKTGSGYEISKQITLSPYNGIRLLRINNKWVQM